jgi:hypothetical protein
MDKLNVIVSASKGRTQHRVNWLQVFPDGLASSPLLRTLPRFSRQKKRNGEEQNRKLGHAVHSVAYAPVLTSADLRCVRTHRKGNMDHVFGGAEIGQDSTSIQGEIQLQRDSPLHGSGRGYVTACASKELVCVSKRERESETRDMKTCREIKLSVLISPPALWLCQPQKEHKEQKV